MITDLQLRVTPKEASDLKILEKIAARQIGCRDGEITESRIVKRSIDARQRKVMINVTLRLGVGEHLPEIATEFPVTYKEVSKAPSQAIIVGAGPAGLFAVLRLLEHGIRPIILERGKDVDSRRKDMAAIARENRVDPDSNYCFGEGGAGAYSDGKLYTRSKKRGSVDRVLAALYRHGAPEDILVDAHPHIGTDRLPEVIKAIRHTIIRHGGEVHFNARVTSLLMNGGEVIGAVTADGTEYHGPVILATGHSARDTYEMLMRQGIAIEPKGIAVGVRLEHPQALIDSIQYHNPEGRGKYLPAAEYSMLTRVDDRGVYSFCMCPGGFIIPAASGPGQLVVNGMSPSSRGTKWANSGMVVEVLPEDVESATPDDPLKMMKFQAEIEARFYEDAGNTHNAPAQRMKDFTESRPSKDLPATSYAPGIHTARVDRLLPEGIARRLQKGFIDFGRKARGFLTNDAVLIGCETRTSSPVRVTRDPETLSHIAIKGLYPCGEGAGYAGGIVSAAIDGERCADALASTL